MAIEISWYQEKQILYSHYSGDVTLEETYQGIREAVKLILNEPHPIPHIMDFTGLGIVHKNLLDYAGIASELKGIDKRNWVIIVGVAGIPMLITSFVTQLAGLNCKMTNSLEEAQTFAKYVASPVDAVPVEN